MPLTSGVRLGPYEVLSLVGAGGMGEVYRARDTRLDRTVAVKILPALAKPAPSHNSIIRTSARSTTSGEHAGTAFLVMQYLEGETRRAIGG